MSEQNTIESFVVKYKRWFIALIGVQLIPVLLLTTLFGGGAIYLYVNNDINFHAYKSDIISGYYAGHSDGARDEISGQIPKGSLWDKYFRETDKLKEKVALEREEYLYQFPEEERGMKLAEMRTNNIKLPLQLELDKRFKRGVDFYADYVKQRVKRDEFNSDAAYQKALKKEAWKAGYSYGYRTGLAGHNVRYGLSELKH